MNVHPAPHNIGMNIHPISYAPPLFVGAYIFFSYGKENVGQDEWDEQDERQSRSSHSSHHTHMVVTGGMNIHPTPRKKVTKKKGTWPLDRTLSYILSVLSKGHFPFLVNFSSKTSWGGMNVHPACDNQKITMVKWRDEHSSHFTCHLHVEGRTIPFFMRGERWDQRSSCLSCATMCFFLTNHRGPHKITANHKNHYSLSLAVCVSKSVQVKFCFFFFLFSYFWCK